MPTQHLREMVKLAVGLFYSELSRIECLRAQTRSKAESSDDCASYPDDLVSSQQLLQAKWRGYRHLIFSGTDAASLFASAAH